VASSADGINGLWLQPLDSLAAKRPEGTERAAQPFWSPDSAALAFFAEGRLKRLDLAGGPPRTLAAVLRSHPSSAAARGGPRAPSGRERTAPGAQPARDRTNPKGL
jgi:hypothetical protein